MDKEHLDIIGRTLKLGDHAVFYNNIYKIVDLRGLDATIFLANPSPTTKKRTVCAKELILLPEQDVIMWLLKRPASEQHN